jgi:hypothetical protein
MASPDCARPASSNIANKAHFIDMTELPAPAAAAGALIRMVATGE